jgi:tetratricopeptide (TPR) repeat protein
MTQMKLMCFGKLELEGCASNRVAQQQLLLLCYSILEGVRPRWELAGLFWSHLAGDFTKKGERKDASNLGVARAILKTDIGLDIEDSQSFKLLECDLLDFRKAIEIGDLETAATLSRRGVFLNEIEHRTRLKIGQDLYQWLIARRTEFNEQTRAVLVQLAQIAVQNSQLERARNLAEEAQAIDQEGGSAETLSKLHQLLLELHSPLADQASTVLTASLEDLQLGLSEPAFKFYLILALQDPINLAAAQRAAELGTKTGADCMQELLNAGLTTSDQKVNVEIARHYLREHPAEKINLLSLLRDHTPINQAYAIYRDIFELSQTFGGVGFWDRARSAYCIKAKGFIELGDFEAAAEVLGQFEQAEHVNQQTPHPENRFLQAYAFERLRQSKRGLEVLKAVQETTEILAIKSALLLSENYAAAMQAAKNVLINTQNTPMIAWSKAIALNTLGMIAIEEKRLPEADMYFDQATVMWALAGFPTREIGALMNRANVLEQLKRYDDAQRAYEEVLTKAGENDHLRVRALLNLGYMYEHRDHRAEAYEYYRRARDLSQGGDLARRDAALVACVFNNLGYNEWKLGLNEQARASLNIAMDTALKSGERLWYALALGNLALVERSVAKLEMALDLLEQLGNQRQVEEYSLLYQQLLKNLALEAQHNGRLDELELYVDKLAIHCERFQRPELANAIRLELGRMKSAVPPRSWDTLLASV